jgi:hemin uptake protein HemP
MRAEPARPGRRAEPPPPIRLNSADLLRGQAEVVIEHAGEVYRLRCTSKGKLILTK